MFVLFICKLKEINLKEKNLRKLFFINYCGIVNYFICEWNIFLFDNFFFDNLLFNNYFFYDFFFGYDFIYCVINVFS